VSILFELGVFIHLFAQAGSAGTKWCGPDHQPGGEGGSGGGVGEWQDHHFTPPPEVSYPFMKGAVSRDFFDL